MDCSMPGLPVHHRLLELTQTHVHLVGDAIQPSHPLSSPSPPAFNLSQHQGLFKWVSSSHEVAKVSGFQLQRHSFQWTPRTDLLWDGLVGSPCCLVCANYVMGSVASFTHIISFKPHNIIRNQVLLTLFLLFNCSVMPNSVTPCQVSRPSPFPRACSNSCPLSQWCHPTISSSIIPFSSCLQSFPASGSFPMSQLFASGC